MAAIESRPDLADLIDVMEAAEIFLAVSVRDSALVLEGEVESEEIRQAALDLAGPYAERLELALEDAIEVMEIDLELGSSVRDEVDSTTMAPGSASTLIDAGTIDPGLSAEEAIPYFPPTDPVIGEQLNEQDEVEVIGGFQPTSDDGDSAATWTSDDERISDLVRRELREDATTTDLANIAVETRNGVVHLRGDVPTLDDAENAEAVAARVPGVNEVREELTVLTMKAD